MPSPTDPECPFCKQYPLVAHHVTCNTDEIWLHVLWCAQCGAHGEIEVEPDTDIVVRTEWTARSNKKDVARSTLGKYIQHVGDCEGVTFIPESMEARVCHGKHNFTEEELQLLHQLRDEGNEEAKCPSTS